MKASKWKKRDRKFNNNKVSFKMMQKNLSISTKMFKVSQTWFATWPHVRINYSHKSESVRFSLKFCSYFIGRGFAYRAKSWIQLRTNTACTLPFLFSKVQAATLNPWSVFKIHLKVHRSSCFRRGWRKEKLFTRKVWGLHSPWSSILRPPKHLFMFFLSILSAKEVICPF